MGAAVCWRLGCLRRPEEATRRAAWVVRDRTVEAGDGMVEAGVSKEMAFVMD